MSHKKMSIAQTMSNLAEQVQMLVQENRAMITLSSGRIVDDEKIGIETRAPAVSHSHPCSDPSDSRLYQPVDLLKERERRPARSASVFDRLGNEADFHQRNTPFHDSRRDHGIKESWTKVFIENKSPIHYMRPIDHSKSKITVVSEVNNKKLAWCNFEQKSITNNAPIRYIETICAVRSLEACANYDSLVGTSWKRYDGIARSSTKKS
ncbi:Uncharacterized protein Fot_07325 [Forsythia ovata]|uniref:Uncharacterized protein n=1 Tax=Forsythia ovata TaxID=205694 RepID=A0ABD1WVI3_9LAMI